MKNHLFLAVALVATAPAVLAQVIVKDPWIRGTVALQTSTGAFMQIISKRDTRLVEARSPIASQVEIHEMRLQNDVMRMRRIEGIDLPAGKQIELKPGGLHLMLSGLKAPLHMEDRVPVSLVFQREGQPPQTIELELTVRALNDNGGQGHVK